MSTQPNETPSYVIGQPSEYSSDVQTAVSALESEYFGDLALYRDSSEYRQKARERFLNADRSGAVRMLEMAYLAEVSSVDTMTEDWETLLNRYLKGQLDRSEFITQTRDGEVKEEKVRHVLMSEIPEMATDAIRSGDLKRAREALTGLLTGDPDDTYARATKSAFVLWLLGFDTLCMDRRIHRALRPLFRSAMVDNAVRPDTVVSPTGRTVRADMDRRVPWTVEFVHDSLKWSVDEMDAYAAVAVDYVDEQTQIPRDRIAQVAFNAGGEGDRTIHRDLMKVLAGR